MKKLSITFIWCNVLFNCSILFAQDRLDIRQISNLYCFWGEPEHVAVEGDYVYVTTDERILLVLDISDPTDPELVYDHSGFSNLNGIQITDNYLWLVNGYDINIFDITDPASPGYVSRIQFEPCGPSEFTISGDYLYVYAVGFTEMEGYQWSFSIFDISNPNSPQQVYQDIQDERVWLFEKIIVRGNYLYTHIGDNLIIMDISDPEHPEEILRLDLQDDWRHLRDFEIIDNYCFALRTRDILALDISDLENIREVCRIDLPETPRLSVVQNDMLYFYYHLNDEIILLLIDISNPNSLQLISELALPGTPNDMAINGDLLLITDESNRVNVVDVSDPGLPEIIGAHVSGAVQSVVVQDDYAYVAMDKKGLGIFDISDLHNPVEVGVCDALTCAVDVAVAGDYAYVADYYSYWESFLRVIDISNPDDPVEVGIYSSDEAIHRVLVSGNFIYMAGHYEFSPLLILDISEPTDPQLIWNSHHHTGGMEIRGDYLFTTDMILNIYDPTNPMTVGSYGNYSMYDHPYGLGIGDNFLYVLVHFIDYEWEYEYDYIKVVDISESANPELMDEIGGPVAYSYSIFNNYMFCGQGSEGLFVYDVSNPLEPEMITSINTPGSAGSLTFAGNIAFVADNTNLGIYDFSDFLDTPEDIQSLQPTFSLSPIYPNPFNTTAEITYVLPVYGHVQLSLYDLSGRLVEELVDTEKPAGRHAVELDGSNLAAGVYFVWMRPPLSPPLLRRGGGSASFYIQKAVIVK